MDHNFRQKLDSISLTSLLSSEAIKWSSGKDIIGAWVAEMDFGIAPPAQADKRPPRSDSSAFFTTL